MLIKIRFTNHCHGSNSDFKSLMSLRRSVFKLYSNCMLFLALVTMGKVMCLLLLLSLQGCAFLHVSKEHQSMIKPLVVSSGFGAGFNSQFIWTGKLTVTHMLVINNYG